MKFKKIRTETDGAQIVDDPDGGDDCMLKMSTIRQTILFLILVTRPGKDGSRLSPGKMKMAEDLAESLTTEFIKIKYMRSILRTLIEELGGDTILEIIEQEDSEAMQKTDS